MRHLFLSALLAALLLASCDRQTAYPVSGEPCAPEDPVKDLTVAECTGGV